MAFYTLFPPKIFRIMRKRILLIVIMAVLSMAWSVRAVSQSTVKGVVVDSETNEPIVGATVTLQGTKNVVFTDDNGRFTLKSPKTKAILQFTCVGYENLMLPINRSGEYDLGFVPLGIATVLLRDAVVTTRAVARKTPVALTTIGSVMIEERIGAADFPKVLEVSPGVYVTRGGGGYGDSKINMRGFKSENVAVLVNGVSMNDMEWGGVYWSNWAGLADVASSIQTQRGLGAAKVSTPSVGGSINIVTKTTDAKRGGFASYAIGNDGYNKLLFNVSTGRTADGWAITLLGGRTAGNGYIQGTEFEGWNYFASVSKELGKNHLLTFTAFGAPQWHNQRSAYDGLTVKGWQEVGKYMPIGQQYRYNPTYGFDKNGQRRTSSKNSYHKPQLQLQHLWQVNNRSSLNTVLYASIGNGWGHSGQGTAPYSSAWYGSNNGVLNQQFRRADGTFDYGAVQTLNENSESGSQMVMTLSRNNHKWYGLVSTYTKEVSPKFNFYGGIDLRYYVGTHTNEISDLYNGTYYIDRYRKNVKPTNYDGAGTDAFVYKKLTVGDVVYRDYDGHVAQGGFFAQGEYDWQNLTAFVSGAANLTSQWRVDRFYYDKDHQKSDKVNKIGFTLKGGANYKFPGIDSFGGQHNVFANLGVISRAPFFSGGAFLASTVSNQINPDAVNEKIFSVEAGYTYHTAAFNLNLNLYHTQWKDKTMAKSYEFVNLSGNADRATINMQGVNSVHSGVEVDLDYKPYKWMSLNGMLSVGDWRWTNNPVGYFYDSAGQPMTKEKTVASGIQAADHAQMVINQKDVKEGGSAQFTAGLGVNLYPLEGVRLGLQWKYFSDYYADYTVSSNDITLGGSKTFTTPWKTPAYGLFDLSAGYSFKMGGNNATLSGNIENLFDQEYINEAYDGGSHDWDTAYRVFYGFGRQMSLRLKVNF